MTVQKLCEVSDTRTAISGQVKFRTVWKLCVVSDTCRALSGQVKFRTVQKLCGYLIHVELYWDR